MKIIIAGSRNFDDKEMVYNFINKSKFDITEVVSGGARGVDKIGEEWAKEHNIPVKIFLPHYSLDTKDVAAPLVRNTDMGRYADGLIAIWLNKSHGTEHMIKTMRKAGKPVEVIDMCPEITELKYIKGEGKKI